jgi:hypothetical protein
VTDIAIDPRIVEEWTPRAADGLLELDMALSSDSPAATLIAAVRDVVDALAAEHQEVIDATHPEPGEEPPWPGEWHAVELADGRVGIRVTDCDRADVFVPRVATGA